MKRLKASTVSKHTILLVWSAIVLFPVWTMLVNSIKPKRDIFRDPFGFPETITFDGYASAWGAGQFGLYFRNSIFVTVVSLVLVLFLGSLAAYALSNWRSGFSSGIYLFFIAGLMVPIRLGTINLFQIIRAMGLLDTIYSLFPVYIAMSLPVTVFVLTAFMQAVPHELYEAARIDGASEWRIYRSIILPLTRPALATATIINLIPIWNDLWFPLIFIRAEEHRTVMLGASLLFGQYQTDWTKILSVLTLATLPVLVLYLLMAKQFIKGLTAGAVKG